jgi:hypothetical protein
MPSATRWMSGSAEVGRVVTSASTKAGRKSARSSRALAGAIADSTSGSTRKASTPVPMR